MKLAISTAVLVSVMGFASAAPAIMEARSGTSYTLDIDLLGLTVATESCASVPKSGVNSFEQYIASLDCSSSGTSGSTKTYTCDLTGDTTGDLGAILGGVSTACGEAGGTPNGGTLIRK